MLILYEDFKQHRASAVHQNKLSSGSARSMYSTLNPEGLCDVGLKR